MRRFTYLALIAAFSFLMAAQETVVPAAAPPYRLFSSVTNEGVVEKLNQHGANGYRFVGITRTYGGALTVLLRRTEGERYEYAAAVNPIYKWRLLETLNAYGAKGFRYIPLTLYRNKEKGFSAADFVALMEKPALGKATFQYHLIAPSTNDGVKKDLSEAVAAGFHAVAVHKWDAQRIVLTERQTGVPTATPSSAEPYRVLTVADSKQREAKLSELAAAGYRLLEFNYSPRPGNDSDFVSLLQSSVATQYRFIVSDVKFDKEYSFSQQVSDFEKAINQAAASGYRLVLPPGFRRHFTGWATLWQEMSVAMEKTGGDTYEYKFVMEEDTPALGEQLSKLDAAGYRVLHMGLLGGSAAIMERPLPRTAAPQ